MAFCGYLKADTETTVTIGPAVAVGDGFTPVTDLSLAAADEAEIIKHNGNSVTDISGGAMAAIVNADGYYALTMASGYLDTEGRITVLINDDDKCLPIRADFMVVNANVFDSLYAAATTDYLQIDTVQIGGVTQSATDLKDLADTGYDPATHKIQSDLIYIHGTALTETDGQLATAFKTLFDVAAPVLTCESVNQSADNNTILAHADYGNAKLVRSTTPANTLDVSATGEAGLDFDNIKDATGAHTLTNITIPTCTTNSDMRGTDNAALAAVCSEARLSELDAGTVGKMANQVDIIQTDTTTDIPGTLATILTDTNELQTDWHDGGRLDLILDAASAPSAAAVADAVWDEAIADHLGAGTTGAKLNTASAAAGAGSITWTYTVTDADTGALLDGVSVWVTSDSAGLTVVASGTTDNLGVVTFYLDAGNYYIWCSKAGYNFSNPDTETVS